MLFPFSTRCLFCDGKELSRPVLIVLAAASPRQVERDTNDTWTAEVRQKFQ